MLSGYSTVWVLCPLLPAALEKRGSKQKEEGYS